MENSRGQRFKVFKAGTGKFVELGTWNFERVLFNVS
jgi:hypothetical protein